MPPAPDVAPQTVRKGFGFSVTAPSVREDRA
jgi:hypothetical protein